MAVVQCTAPQNKKIKKDRKPARRVGRTKAAWSLHPFAGVMQLQKRENGFGMSCSQGTLWARRALEPVSIHHKRFPPSLCKFWFALFKRTNLPFVLTLPVSLHSSRETTYFLQIVVSDYCVTVTVELEALHAWGSQATTLNYTGVKNREADSGCAVSQTVIKDWFRSKYLCLLNPIQID